MYYMNMKTEEQPTRNEPDESEIVEIAYGAGQQVRAELRKCTDPKYFTDLGVHERSYTDKSGSVGRLGEYSPYGPTLVVGMAAVLLLKEGDAIHTEFCENKAYIGEIIGAHLDCVYMVKEKFKPNVYSDLPMVGMPPLHKELDFIRFTQYLQRELENKWKWRDRAQLLLVKMVKTGNEYKIVPVPLCAIDIQQSIDVKYANSLCDLIERVVESVIESETVEECFERIITDYKRCGVKTALAGNYKMVISTVIAGTIPVLLEKIF